MKKHVFTCDEIMLQLSYDEKIECIINQLNSCNDYVERLKEGIEKSVTDIKLYTFIADCLKQDLKVLKDTKAAEEMQSELFKTKENEK